jgi:hypothetical protein
LNLSKASEEKGGSVTTNDPSQLLKDWNERKPHVACIFLDEPALEIIVSGRVKRADSSGVRVGNRRARFCLGFSSRKLKVIYHKEMPKPIQSYNNGWVCGLQTGAGNSEIFVLEFPCDTALSTLDCRQSKALIPR